MKNRICELLMETGVSYQKLPLYRMWYSEQLRNSSEEVPDSMRPLLRPCREQIDRDPAGYGVAAMSRTRSVAGRQTTAAENHPGSGTYHGALM